MTFYLAHYSWFMFSKLASTPLQPLDLGFFPMLIDECKLGGFPVSFSFDLRQCQ